MCLRAKNVQIQAVRRKNGGKSCSQGKIAGLCIFRSMGLRDTVMIGMGLLWDLVRREKKGKMSTGREEKSR